MEILEQKPYISPILDGTSSAWQDKENFTSVLHRASEKTLYMNSALLKRSGAWLLEPEGVARLGDAPLPLAAIIDWCHVMHGIALPAALVGEPLVETNVWKRNLYCLMHVAMVNEYLGVSNLKVIQSIFNHLINSAARPKMETKPFCLVALAYIYRHYKNLQDHPVLIAIIILLCSVSPDPFSGMPFKLAIALSVQKPAYCFSADTLASETWLADFLKHVDGLYEFCVSSMPKMPCYSHSKTKSFTKSLWNTEANYALHTIPVFESLLSMPIGHLYDIMQRAELNSVPFFMTTDKDGHQHMKHNLKQVDALVDGIHYNSFLPEPNYELASKEGVIFPVHDWIVASAWPFFANFLSGKFTDLGHERRLELPLGSNMVAWIISMCYGSEVYAEVAVDDMSATDFVEYNAHEHLELPLLKHLSIGVEAVAYFEKKAKLLANVKKQADPPQYDPNRATSSNCTE